MTYPKSSMADDGASNQDVLELSGDNKAIVTTQVLKLIPHAKKKQEVVPN